VLLFIQTYKIRFSVAAQRMVRACSCLSLVVAAANRRQHPTLLAPVTGRRGCAVMLGLTHSAASALVLT
jgi:hypothetical protein